MIAVVEDRLLTIGDFARLVGLSSSALRFYDDCDLLKPAAVDEGSGYRYYSHDQVTAAEIIRECRKLGMPLALARRVLQSPADAEKLVVEFWDREQEDLTRRAEAFETLKTRLKGRDRYMTSWWVDASDLRKGVSQVVWAAAKAPVEPEVLSSVFVECGDEVRLVATDRYRLAIRDLVPSRVEGGDEASTAVEADELVGMAASLPDGEARLVIDGGTLSVSCGDFLADLSSAHDEFLPYRHFVTDEHSTSALVDVDVLSGALEPLRDAKATVVEFSSRGLVVSGHKEAVSTEVPAEVTGEPLRAGFNAQFLLECVLAADGPDVLIQATSPTQPFVIRSATDGSFTTRLMPVKLS